MPNTPLPATDPTGHWVETAWDLANLALSAAAVWQNPSDPWTWAALAADTASTVLPIVPGGAGAVIRTAAHADEAASALPAMAHADEAAGAAQAEVRGGNEFIDDLPDDDILCQYSRPPKDGQFQGFPKDLRPGESGMSCQIASQCGNDPVRGFRQQFGREPGPGDWVRTTTVRDVKQWGGRVEADGGKPGLPVGHGTIYSTGGKWGKPFARIWRNERPLVE